MIIEGTLEEGELVPALRSISALGQSGLLSVQGEPDLVSVTFDRGAVVAADAMNRPAEDLLGEVLARRGLLSPADFAAAVEPHMGTGRLASEVLAAEGLVDREELLHAVREQTYAQVVRLLRWESGNFNWTPDVESPFEAEVEPLSVAELLLRAVDDLGPEGPLRGRMPELDESFRARQGPRVLIVGRDGDWQVPTPDAVWLTPAEGLLQELLGQRPAAVGRALALETSLTTYEVRYGLFVLLELGLAEVVESVEAAAPPAAALAVGAPSAEVELTEETPPILEESAESASPLQEAESWPGIEEPAASTSPELTEEAVRLHTETDWESERLSDRWVDEGLFEPTAADDDAPGEHLEADDHQEPEPPVELPEWAASGDSFEPVLARRPRRSSLVQRSSAWLARGLGVALALVLLLTVFWPDRRSGVLFPYPWQSAARSKFEQDQNTALFQKVDQAIRTYYLLYGRYPEELGLLVDLQLLRSSELYDSRGRWLSYAVADGSYTLAPVESEAVPGPSPARAEVGTDFLLNPKFVELPRARPNPLVLLD